MASNVTCSANADRRRSLSVIAMTGLETAADILGSKVRLAEVLSIDPRSLRNKIDACRGITPGDLITTAAALDRLAARAAAHAEKLRNAAGSGPETATTPRPASGASA